MNNMKKFASLLLALVMVLAMAVPAMAATITNNTSNHTYDAYQIFTGSQAASEGALGNIQWGSGVNSSDLLNALKQDTRFVQEQKNIFEACTTAADVADVLDGYNDDSAVAKAFADVVADHLTNAKTAISETVELAKGYYLLVDTTDVDDKHDAKNAALLHVTDDITIKNKYDVPEVEKKVTDTETNSQPAESADANIGDTVTFTLTATMPNTFEGYDTYKVIFHDTMSAGLAYGSITSVVVNNKTLTNEEYTATPTVNTDGTTTLTVTIDDVLKHGATASSTVVVTYTAIVDDDAVIGSDGNSNKVYLEFSNDPNWNGEGDEPTGDTPEDEVKVYTWEIPAYKWTADSTAEDGKKPLAGAGFTLYTDANCTTAVNLVATNDSTIYKVCTQTECTDHKHVTEITTDNTGKFEIEGLQKGTYYLKETTTPAGYNTCDVVTVVIGEDGALTMNGSATTEVTVENKAGSTLPETGGMGTTVIYVAGGLLVAAAVIIMISRRRRAA